tara:strand:+ start:3321 stop:4136 length:816 start_codon:yes stop_codon:yes gene_type:complete
MKREIFIPTYKRLNAQITLAQLDTASLPPVTIVCMEEEADTLSLFADKVISLPAGAEAGIHHSRQFIQDYCMEEGIEECAIFDDDIQFMIRKDTSDLSAWQLRSSTREEVVSTILDMFNMLDFGGYGTVGISHRQGNNRYTKATVENQRMFSAFTLKPSQLDEYDIRFDRQPFMDDFYMQLSLLTRGIPTAMICDRAVGDAAGSNSQGGCSEQRTINAQEEAAHILAAHFPDFVKTVQKETKTGWFKGRVRTDVRIAWKKAYQYGVNNRPS